MMKKSCWTRSNQHWRRFLRSYSRYRPFKTIWPIRRRMLAQSVVDEVSKKQVVSGHTKIHLDPTRPKYGTAELRRRSGTARGQNTPLVCSMIPASSQYRSTKIVIPRDVSLCKRGTPGAPSYLALATFGRGTML